MKIISINVNGIRAAASKGFFTWLHKQNAEVICMQETRAQQQQLTDAMLNPFGYYSYFSEAEKKGYSGVAIYSKRKPRQINKYLGWETADNEGRYLQAYFDDIIITSIYLPSGTSGSTRQAIKEDFLARYLPILRQPTPVPQIICGDFNIAHTKQDIKNWRSNQNNSGFLPIERAWMDEVLASGYIDAFRHINPDSTAYSWWSNRSNAYSNDVGWRIDYHIVSAQLQPLIQTATIIREPRFSDHAPVCVEYAL